MSMSVSFRSSKEIDATLVMSSACPAAEDSEFKLVVSKKGKHRTKARGKLHTSFNRAKTNSDDCLEVCRDTVIKQLEAAQLELLQSTFFAESFEHIRPILAGVERIICLGLGNFAQCSIARYQLAFILCLRDKASLSKKKVEFYDPVFSASEVQILDTLAETVLQENVEGKYTADRRTLFYLPHCPKQIVNNLLWKNWQPALLPNVVLICNSFGTTVGHHPRRLLENSASYILQAAGAFEEVPLRNNFRYTDIFNDTSLHYLPSSERLEDGAWTSTAEPSYEVDDLELITKELTDKLVLP